MEKSIFKFILKYSKKNQIKLFILTVFSFPFLYLSLELPKIIVNEAIGGDDFPKFLNFPPTEFFITFYQIPFLVTMSFIFLGLVFINGGFKYTINVQKGRMGERMLRRLRYMLYHKTLQFPLSHYKKISSSEIIPIVTAEVEPLGGFIGDAFILPLFQGGTLLVYVSFIFLQDPLLGAAAVALYPIQFYIIPKLQKRVNLLAKQRVQMVRKLSDRIGESISGVKEIKVHNTFDYEKARLSDQLGNIYFVRYDIFRKKFFIKFLNNFLAQLTPFFFFLFGGYFVIQGNLTFGALVAVLAAYKDLASPWKELLNYYQRKEDIKIKYQQIIEQFDFPDSNISIVQKLPKNLIDDITFSNVTVSDDEENNLLDHVSCDVKAGCSTIILGKNNSGAEELAMSLARLSPLKAGTIKINNKNILSFPEIFYAKKVTYLDYEPYFFNGTIRDNLFYVLKDEPPEFKKSETSERCKEATASGNSQHPIDIEWVKGIDNSSCPETLNNRLLDLIKQLGMQDDLYNFGIRSIIHENQCYKLESRILEARYEFRTNLDHEEVTRLIETFDWDQYNSNASVAENLLFGTPLTDRFDIKKLSENDYVLKILHETDLYHCFLQIGYEAGELMLEIFGDLEEGASPEFIEKFSFIDAETIANLKSFFKVIDKKHLTDLSEPQQNLLLSIPFKLVPAKHRLDVITEEIQKKILEARYYFWEHMPDEWMKDIEQFNIDLFSSRVSILDNIVFGRIVHGKKDAVERVLGHVKQVLQNIGLEDDITLYGLNVPVGAGGSRLSLPQKQKLAIIRAFLKDNDIIIFNQPMTSVDSKTRMRLYDQILNFADKKTLIWVMNDGQYTQFFDRAIIMQSGRIIDEGKVDDLMKSSVALKEFLPN